MGTISTREDVIATKMVDMLSDLRIDLDMIGIFFGQYARKIAWRRLEYIYEVAKFYRENEGSKETHYEYIQNINN